MVRYGFCNCGVCRMGKYVMASVVGNIQLVSTTDYLYGCTKLLSFIVELLELMTIFPHWISIENRNILMKHTDSR